MTLLSDPGQTGSRGIVATYFDAVTTTAQPVRVLLQHDRVIVQGGLVARDEPIGAVSFSEHIGRTPRFLRFSDGALCEVSTPADLDALHAMLGACGVDVSRVSVWEGSVRWALLAMAVLVLTVFAGYRYGLPALARVMAANAPPSALNGLSRQVLFTLDRTSVLRPTHITTFEQHRIRSALVRLRLSRPGMLQLVFRDSPALGANAFALPSGAVVVTDDLVVLASTPEDVVAVLAHEAGHVEGRHGLRNMIQSSVMTTFVTWYVGDVSALASAAPTALLQARYSRDLEREADDYAARVLEASGIPTATLADMLDRLAAQHDESDARMFRYLASHPATAERTARLRGQIH